MLSQLYIKNIAVIKELTIDFISGFNVFTGETGAGKTILINAINAVLGERTSKDIIRTGEDKAFVSAIFTDIPSHVIDIMNEMGFDISHGEDLLISREIIGGDSSKTNCKINGKPATASILKAISSELISIHGQHDSGDLMNIDKHIEFIDSFGEIEGDIESYRTVYNKMSEIKSELKAFNINEAEKERKMDLLTYQINEITDASLEAGEEDTLLADKKIIKNSEHIVESLNSVYVILKGDEDSSGVCDMLDSLSKNLGVPSKYIDSFESMDSKVQDMLFELEEYSSLVRDSIEEMDFDPNKLDEIEGRLDLIYRLKKKYGNSVDEILGYLDKAQAELDNISFAEEKVAKLEAEYNKLNEEAKKLAEKLTEKRKLSGEQFVARLENELSALDMPLVKLVISCKEKDLSPNGADEIEFLISTNAGEAPKPLAKIASGGEMSRVMLSIKNVMANKEQIGTLIFDEIDTGVSGRSAGKIGMKLKQVSQNRQVICVTHLAQVASYGDNHLFINKVVEDNHTYTRVKTLTADERKYEIARIIGGENITDISLKNAEEMLKFSMEQV